MSNGEGNITHTALINASKGESMRLNENYRSFQRKLMACCKILINMDEITQDVLNGITLFIIPGPRRKFTESEFNAMRKYMETGGSILVLLGESGGKTHQTNINFLLEEYGIMVNSDIVVRTSYYKYFYPKECYVSDGVINRALPEACGKSTLSASNPDSEETCKLLSFVYPYGATLNVAKPAVPLLSSGSVAYPVNRPVCAVYSHKGSEISEPGNGGKLGVMGSVQFLADAYIDKEDNEKVWDFLYKYLTTSDIALNPIDAEAPEINDYATVPEIPELSERPRPCLLEASDDVPSDLLKIFKERLHCLNTDVLPDVLQAYRQLHIKHETLHLITPLFECPLPPFEPAVFPPSFQDIPPPALELFDLDEAFSAERIRLCQLANKCVLGGTDGDETDLEYFVLECAEVLNIEVNVMDDPDAKQILHKIGSQIVEFKKLTAHGSE